MTEGTRINKQTNGQERHAGRPPPRSAAMAGQEPKAELKPRFVFTAAPVAIKAESLKEGPIKKLKPARVTEQAQAALLKDPNARNATECELLMRCVAGNDGRCWKPRAAPHPVLALRAQLRGSAFGQAKGQRADLAGTPPKLKL